MHRLVEQVPIERDVVVPFALLAELAAHEQQLLARMRPHPGEIGAKVGEALPGVARHLVEQRVFAVHHLVMRQRQHEFLRIGIDKAERHLVVVVLTKDRRLRHVGQCVVHPAHVPLQREAERHAVAGA